MSFDLNAIMDGLGVRLAAISGLRVSDFTPDSVAVPAGIIGFPDGIDYDQTYANGATKATFPVYVLVGQVSDRASRDAIAPYAADSGAKSVKAVFEADVTLAGAAKTLRVQRADFTRSMVVGGLEYLTVSFDVEVYA